ncbi:MAG: ABC transporter ATP-binding protein [Sphingobacteriaceae bacterium]
MSTHSFLEVKAVTKSYPGERFAGINNLSLQLSQGKITAIIGESGSGKSTLLKLLYGLVSPDEGEVFFRGEQVMGPEEKLLPGHDAMKMVTQQFDDLNLYARVWDNVAHLLPNTNLEAKQEKTQHMLTQLRIAHLHDHRIADLSGGEKQRVAIARALVTNPTVLLLDEPFNQVDASFREQLQHDIRQIVDATGLTVVLVSHDPAEVLSLADELLVLRSGEMVETGSPKQLYDHPEKLYTAKLLANATVLTSLEAKTIGVGVNKRMVLIYPEWVQIRKTWSSRGFKVLSILFKGFYEELLIGNGSIQLRTINFQPGKYIAGDRVKAVVKRYLDFDPEADIRQ